MKHRGLKFLSLLLTLVLLVGLLPGMTAFADVQAGLCGDEVMWSYDTTTYTLTISGSGAMEDYSMYGLRPWDGFASEIKTVVITDGVTSIGDSAFSYCSDLTSVTIPNSVTTIGEGAFAVTGLSSVTIPNSVTTIGDSAFVLTSLSSVTIPNSVTTIGNAAFSPCMSLKSVTIGSGVTTIGGWAFAGSSNLSSVTFVPGAADKTVAIGDDAFDPTADTLAYGAGSTRLFEGNTEIEAGTARDKLNKLNGKILTWKSTGYTVTFKPGAGSGQDQQLTATAGADFELPTAETWFTAPEGQVFVGWKDDATDTVYKPGDKIQGVDKDYTFTAQWKESSSGGEKKTGGSGSGFDLVFNIPGADNSWEYVGGGYAPQQAYRVSLAPMQGGSAALGLTTGDSGTALNVYPSTTVYVFPNAEQGYTLDKIVWSLIDGSASYDITEAKNFVMPAMDVVVYVTFKPVG